MVIVSKTLDHIQAKLISIQESVILSELRDKNLVLKFDFLLDISSDTNLNMKKMEMYRWCLANMEQDIFFSANEVFFNNERDMLLFKLKF